MQTFKVEQPNSSRRRAYLFIFLFIVSLFVVAQLLVAYIFSIWDRSRVENTLSTSLQRKVHIGKINWRVGIRGLAFDTEEIAIQNKDSTPFFHAGKTTILFGIFPLLHGRLRIKHLDLQQPQAWIERLTQTEWNFSDLPQADIFSKFADCKVTDGSLQLIDKRSHCNIHYATTELKQVQFETHRPFGKYFWPFTLSAQIEQPEGLCMVSLKGSGSGSLNEWRNCHYSFVLIAHNFAPMRLTDFVDSIPETEGTIDLEIKGSSVPSAEFKGNTSIKTDRLIIKPPGLAPLKISHATAQAQVLLNKKQIAWKDLSLKVADNEFKSDGKLDQWLSALPTYEAKLDSRMEDLKQVLHNIDAQWITSRLASLPKDFAFSGKIDLFGSIMGKYPNQQFPTEIILHNARIKLKDRNFVLSAIDGSIKSDQAGLHVRRIKGSLNRGNIEASTDMIPGKTNTIKVKGNAIAIEDMKALTAIIHIPSMLDKINVHGNIKTIDISISGNTKQPEISFTANPDGVVLEGQDHNQILKINNGLITCNNNDLALSKLTGTLGNGNFLVDGHLGLVTTAPANISLSGQHLDLSSAKFLMQSLGFQDKLVSDQLFLGKIKDIKLHMFNTGPKRQLTLDMIPEDILYEPIDSSKAIHLVDGAIKYENEILTLTNVTIKGTATQCTTSATISHCTTQPQLDNISIDNATLDLKEIRKCFTAAKNPQPIRQSFKKLLDNYGISAIKGTLTGNLSAENINTNNARWKMNCLLHAAQFKHSGQIIAIAAGTFTTNENNDLDLQGINCSINKSNFTIDGQISNFHNIDTLQARLKIRGQIYYQDFAPFFSAPANALRADQAISINGVMTLQGPTLTIGTSQIAVGQVPFQTAGTINGILDPVPNVDIKTWIHDPIPVQKIFDVINQGQSAYDLGQAAGSLHGGVHIRGPINGPMISGGCTISAGRIPKLNVTNISGHLKMAQNSTITFKFDTVNFGPISIKDISGSAICSLSEPRPSIKIDNVKGSLAGGSLTGSAVLKLNDQLPFNTHIQLKGLDTSELTKQFGGKKNELTGKADLALTLAGNAKSWAELINSLSGSGSFRATSGRIDKLSQLQIKIEEANLLEQGIVGFRLSNVLATVEPQESGEFLSTSGQLKIDNGIVQLQNIIFDGEELKLQSSGTLNLNTKQIVLHTNGDIAHIGEEGSLGKVASLTSVAALADLVSKGLRSKTATPRPSHPFVFEVDGYLDRPNTIASSIAKSFHWTANPSKVKIH